MTSDIYLFHIRKENYKEINMYNVQKYIFFQEIDQKYICQEIDQKCMTVNYRYQ